MNTIKYVKVNFSNMMECIENARNFSHNTMYFKNDGGEMHKVHITYAFHRGGKVNGSGLGSFELTVNDIEMGGQLRDFGDVYDLLRSCIDV